MLKNITQALSLSLLVTLSTYPNNVFCISSNVTEHFLEKSGAGFESLEHKYLGDLIQLHITTASSVNGVPQITLPNGMKMTYGEIIMFAGDMFGDPSKPISSCSEKNRLSCFKAQFDAMATQGSLTDTKCSNPINQYNKINTYLNVVEKDLELSRQKGISDWEFYKKNDPTISKNLNKITCGGSIISGFIPYGNYIKLAQANFDHFAPDSLVAYKAGHRYALETALKGYQKMTAGKIDEANQLLELAYAENGVANHFLTDSFSAGHMRTPRRAIDTDIHLPSAVNLLIANLMHNEDNQHGLNVVNAEGNSWLAYGDGNIFKPDADVQRDIILQAMQRSADGIYDTFINGTMPDFYPEMNLFPDYSKIEQLNQTAALFKVENGVLLKRVKNKDIYDFHWTRYWSGLFTLIDFN